MATRSNRAFIICALSALAGCGHSGGDSGGNGPLDKSLIPTPKTLVTLKEEQSCAAYGSYVSESIANLVINAGVVACPGCDAQPAGGVGIAQSAAGTTAGGAATALTPTFDGFTGTNNQEAGVDELDQIETDVNGNFYLIDGRNLVVANGLPPSNLREIASLELDPARRAEGLLLDADNERLVVVLSPSFVITANAPIIWPGPWVQATELYFVDVSDPANPVIDRRLKVEGFKLAVRRVGDRVHLVTHMTPVIPASIIDDAELLRLRQSLTTSAGDGAKVDALEQQVRDRVDTLVAAADIRDFLPEIEASDGLQSYVDVSPANCADVANPDVPLALALTSVTSVDSDGTNVDSLSVANNAWNVYASADNLYLSQASAGWWFSDRQRQQTAIYKIGIGAGAPEYRATGLVDGWADSTFQFSEQDGYLRVVTNRWEFDPGPATTLRHNNLYVLEDDQAGSLDVVGAVKGFAANERIYSARFLGDRGFVVTFRQIDPLFTFDLSDPRDPRLVGQVEIPGVSTYVHPLDASHLLTIGYDGDDTRLNGDFSLQIFDVQNLDDPRLIHKFVPQFGAAGFAWTPATFDHLAFNYFPAAGTLTVPVQYYASNLSDQFSGFIAFSVDVSTGFAELGRLDHSDLARQEYCSSATGQIPVICSDGSYLESAIPRRSVSADWGGETYIYTLSNVGMKVSPAGDFENPVGVLPLPYRDDYPWLIAQ